MNRLKATLPLILLPLVLAGCNDQALPTESQVGPAFSMFSSEFGSSFTEDFSGGASSLLEKTGPTSLDYVDGDVKFGGSTDASRSYLRTIRSDYLRQDFVAEVTVTVAGGGGVGIAFFGFGQGNPNCGFFCEPAVSPAVYARVSPSDFGGDFGITTAFGSITQSVGGVAVGGGGNGTHRLRMTSSTCGALTFEIDKDWTGGPFTADHQIGPIALLAGSFDATNSRIFMGGAGNIRFDDIDVSAVPAAPCVATVSTWSEFKAALDNPIIDEIHLSSNIEIPSNASGFVNQFGRLFIGRTVTIRGFGHRLNFAHGELIIGSPSMSSDVVVTLSDIELRVWNPTWRIPASAYGVLVHRGTLIGNKVFIDLRWTTAATQWGSGSAAPAGLTTHYGVLTQGWTVRAELTNSAIRVFSESGNPYGAYASAGSAMKITGTFFDVSRSDTSLLVQGIAVGLQDELPAGFPAVPRIYADVTASGNRSNGSVSHTAMVYRASGDLDDAGSSAAAILEKLLRSNQLLPACGLLLPTPEEQCLAPRRGLRKGRDHGAWGLEPLFPGS
jgi:hypothetical protein